MQFLGLLFEFLEATFGITVDDILGVFTDIELGLERLRRANDAFLEAFQTHFFVFSESPKFENMTVAVMLVVVVQAVGYPTDERSAVTAAREGMNLVAG